MVKYKYSFLEPHEVNHTQCYFEEMSSDKGKVRKGKMKPFVFFETNFIYLAKLEKEYSRLICLVFYERFTSKCDLSFDDDKNEVEVVLWDSGEEFTCTNNDEELFTNCTNGSPVITLGGDGVCTVQGMSKVIEDKFHVQFTTKKKMLAREGNLKPSVIVLALHRVSRLNFMRSLPKSFSFVNDTSGMFVFEKHARTGGDWTENFVNLISGRKTPLHDGKPDRKPDLYEGSLFDMFSKLNYVVAGDYPLGDSRPFRRLGFPENVFPNSLAPFWDWVEENTQNISNPQCLGSRHRVEYEVDYLLSIVNSMSRFPYFYFNVLSNLTHSNLNNAQILDDALYRFLNDAFAFGKLDRTFLFLLSEEGFPVEEAAGDFEDEALEQLKAEVRAPFLALHTPPHFEDFLPKLKDTLRHNQRQVTTHFDVFESIRDLVLLHAQEDPGSLRSWSSPPQGSFGHSLWKTLPPERSCETMGVDDINCPCKL
ncbi:uncharacterized protein LOC143018313 [Oratosquilla oratoria]|uniref:uncharacterized protein LOC143018313 n=1 Tax=Oratosquilla oratoria TaxID=337810 RepID=UPI003F764740